MNLKALIRLIVFVMVIFLTSCNIGSGKYLGLWECRQGNDAITLNIARAGKAFDVYDDRMGFGRMVFTEDNGVLKGPYESVITLTDQGHILYRSHEYIRK
jgi:hypothetical protein